MKRIFLLLSLIIGLPVLFFAFPGPAANSPLNQLTGLVHVGYFALLARQLAGLPLLTKRPPAPQISMIMTAILIIGGAVELIQPHFGRSASWRDLGLDLAGGLIGLAFSAPGKRRLPRTMLAGSRLAALGLTGMIFSGPAATLWDMHQAARTFPMLGDFENPLQSRRWSCGEIDHQVSRQGTASLRVAIDGTERYAGTTLRRSIGNWQGYSTFAFSVYNPAPEPISIIVSIRDQEHFQRGGRHDDRFNRTFRINQGWNDIHIPVAEIETAPADRLLDLSRLSELAIFTVNPRKATVIHLDNIRLIQ